MNEKKGAASVSRQSLSPVVLVDGKQDALDVLLFRVHLDEVKARNQEIEKANGMCTGHRCWNTWNAEEPCADDKSSLQRLSVWMPIDAARRRFTLS